MSSDRWRVVKGLFYRAIKLPPEAWPDYLDLVTAGDDDLRSEVASLLAEHDPEAGSRRAPLPSDAPTVRPASVVSVAPQARPADASEEPTDA
jgi:hypothetical protein